MKSPTPPALASVHRVRTASGPLLKVRLIAANLSEPLWRSYPPGTRHDEAVIRALASTGVARAWVQGALPEQFSAGNG